MAVMAGRRRAKVAQRRARAWLPDPLLLPPFLLPIASTLRSIAIVVTTSETAPAILILALALALAWGWVWVRHGDSGSGLVLAPEAGH
jgi:hypothetical protein